MRPSRLALVLWGGLIVVLLFIEVAELTHLFTLPIASAIDDPVALVVALVFTTIIALVGAIFIGIYISHRMLSPAGFTPFEEEMLRMRQDVSELKASVQARRAGDPPDRPPGAGP
jgi:hypothetical protein